MFVLPIFQWYVKCCGGVFCCFFAYIFYLFLLYLRHGTTDSEAFNYSGYLCTEHLYWEQKHDSFVRI